MAFTLDDPGSIPGVGAMRPPANVFHIPGFGAGQTSGQTAAQTTNFGMPSHLVAGGTSGTNPYAFNIGSDPLYNQLQSQVAAENQAAQGGLTTGFGQALANYGQIPDFAQTAQQLGLDASSPLYALLMHASQDPNTQQAANALNQSGVSTYAQLQQQHQTGMQNLINDLSARGAVQSGDALVGQRLEQQADTQRQYQAQQSLLQSLGQLVGQYNTQNQQGINQLTQGAQSAAARQIALNPNVPAALSAQIMAALTPAASQAA